jgi:hypothetical protein
LSGHEATINKLKKKIVYYNTTLKTYKKSYMEYNFISKKLVKINKALEQENLELNLLLKEINKRVILKEQKFENIIKELKKKHQSELKKVIEKHMENEILLNSKIQSLQKDLERYFKLIKSKSLEKSVMVKQIKRLLSKFDNPKKEKKTK